MSKTLVLAEKPSVGRDIAKVLQCQKKGNGFLERDQY
ncbi:DNA topoisomerase III, partial [Brevibacillus agri BAB-2500]